MSSDLKVEPVLLQRSASSQTISAFIKINRDGSFLSKIYSTVVVYCDVGPMLSLLSSLTCFSAVTSCESICPTKPFSNVTLGVSNRQSRNPPVLHKF